MLNTSAVAKLLGVSPSTVQRWVKQLELQMDRNELGHYIFSENDIKLLKQIQEQLNKGIILQDVTIEGKKTRKGSIKDTINNQSNNQLFEKLADIEQQLNRKADDVVSYQLLQHRKEIEELRNTVKLLTARVEKLEKNNSNNNPDDLIAIDHEKPIEKIKRKNFITTLFGF